MSVPSLYDAHPMNNFSRGRSFDDSDPYFGINKQTKARGLKSIAANNVKASNVAKIKVVVERPRLGCSTSCNNIRCHRFGPPLRSKNNQVFGQA